MLAVALEAPERHGLAAQVIERRLRNGHGPVSVKS